MEDPWGSPWASADTPPDNDPPPSSRANTFLSPPPKAFFGNVTSLPAQLPWSGNDDDGPSIWATADRADGTNHQSDWGVWGDSGAQLSRLSPWLGSGRKSPLARPASAASSLGSVPRSRSRTPSILRHRSPDPWATQPSSANRLGIEIPKPSNLTANDTPTTETRTVEEAFRLSQTVTESGIEGIPTDRIHIIGGGTSNEARAIGESKAPVTSCDLDDKCEKPGSNLDPAVCELPSPPLSTFTLDSQDETNWQDSPITSIDEDRGNQSQNRLQNISEKEQGLADDIAEAALKEPPTLDPRKISRGQSHEKSSRTSETENSDTAGELEDASVNDGAAAGSSTDASSELSSTPKVEVQDAFTRERKHKMVENHTTVTEIPPIQSQNTVNKFGSITFDTNLALVDELFPDFADSLGSSIMGDRDIASDHLSDSFTSISERKAWYRISRYGSMRKHNLGDDENYLRVAWPTSQLHADVIKIARRWMEEDLYAGKAIFGGTKRTGFFDWDSNAAPVKLDEVFRRRKSISKHTRTTSIPANNEIKPRPFLDERPYRNSTGITFSRNLPPVGSPIMPIPGFGRNHEPKLSQTSSTTQLSQQNSQCPTPMPESDAAPILPHQLTPIRTTSADDDDDDDEWGEMVSSPLVEKHMQPSITAHPLSETPVENKKSSLQSSSTPPDITNSMESIPSLPLITRALPSSDTSSSSDMAVLETLNEDPELPLEHTPQPLAHSTSAPIADFSHKRNQGSITGLRAPGRDTITGQAPVDETLPTTTARIDTPMAVSPVDTPRNESEDDLIVQNILQNLPDMSYMLR